MNGLIPMQEDEFGLFADVKNNIWANSLKVAEYFGKNHHNVLRDISRLDCSPEFNKLNFEAITYIDERNRTQPAVNMTRDGFIFLVMGYRGKEAAAIKEFYISRFNMYEKEARKKAIARAQSKPPQRTFTDVIKACTPPEYLKPHTYQNYVDMAFKAALGRSAKQLRRERNIPDTAIIEDYMTAVELEAVNEAKARITALLLGGTNYFGVKAALLPAPDVPKQ